ncbi:branched-chain amino acid ABC transporter ATP-binding protein/permease [Rhizobium alvei]|uniref:ATP-binding cassette domain-containing protein n=1 Tax=Rhizobium alvei TaxID=1132659 RepID=A0ABT8YRY5_9HYPH|nr:ATP-binding cassette domain-containing protein [Rhizobium alvei]MDO6966039.1 ATP-binding cassette domain-containing protein [Rhizobium alvei]
MKRASGLNALKTAVSIISLGLICLFLLPAYWVYLVTAVFIIGVSLQSMGIVVGRAGMISLCQMSFAGVGAWTVGYLNLAGFPGGLPVWIVIGGLAAVPFGVAIGLPALRLRGINLAIVTLGFAVAFGVVLGSTTFPGQTTFTLVARPTGFESDTGYFVFVVGVYCLIAVAIEFLVRSRLGASWLAVRHSERAAASLGVSVPRAKLSAFAISAFLAGIAGGLLTGYMGTALADNFSMMQSLTLFAVATMVGAHFTLGAIIGGLLVAFFPELLRRLNLPQDFGSVLFGIGAVQALSTGETISETFLRLGLKWLSRPATDKQRAAVDALPAARVFAEAERALEVRDLTVRYGNVVAVNAASLAVPRGKVVGLIGPNGAGKSTFVDAITGFIHQYDGEILFQGTSIDALNVTQRARVGIRRTWQTTRIAPELTVGDYIHLSSGGELDDEQIDAVLAWLGCPSADALIDTIDAGARRLLDVAGVVAARPPVILLDEPAAGQSYAEAVMLGQRIAEIPSRFGSSVLLIEHDMDLVRTACSEVTVLDFGTVIATGPTRDVLAMPIVQKAYMGIDIDLEAAE